VSGRKRWSEAVGRGLESVFQQGTLTSSAALRAAAAPCSHMCVGDTLTSNAALCSHRRPLCSHMCVCVLTQALAHSLARS